jgi:hypothetical protein
MEKETEEEKIMRRKRYVFENLKGSQLGKMSLKQLIHRKNILKKILGACETQIAGTSSVITAKRKT